MLHCKQYVASRYLYVQVLYKYHHILIIVIFVV